MAEVNIDIDKMTVGEFEDVEQIVGRPISHELGTEGAMRIDTFRALAQVWMRRSNPAATAEDARALTFKEVALAKAADPTPEPLSTGDSA